MRAKILMKGDYTLGYVACIYQTLLCVQSSQLAETSLAVPKGHQVQLMYKIN